MNEGNEPFCLVSAGVGQSSRPERSTVSAGSIAALSIGPTTSLG